MVVRGPQLERPYVRHKDLKVGGPKGSLGGKLPLGGPVEVKNLVNPPLGPHAGNISEDNNMRGGTDNKVAVGEEEDAIGTEGIVLGKTAHVDGGGRPLVEADGCEGARPAVEDNEHPARARVCQGR